VAVAVGPPSLRLKNWSILDGEMAARQRIRRGRELRPGALGHGNELAVRDLSHTSFKYSVHRYVRDLEVGHKPVSRAFGMMTVRTCLGLSDVVAFVTDAYATRG